MNLYSEISTQTDKFAKKSSIVSTNPDECAKLIESWRVFAAGVWTVVRERIHESTRCSNVRPLLGLG